MVANDLCIKAKNRCGSVKQSSFQWFGVFRATRHFYTSNRGFAVTIFFFFLSFFLSLYTARPSFEYYRQVYFVHSGFIMIDDTTVKLLSLKRQKIGMIHIYCFQPKHMATYVVGARKPSQETFLLRTQNIRGL